MLKDLLRYREMDQTKTDEPVTDGEWVKDYKCIEKMMCFPPPSPQQPGVSKAPQVGISQEGSLQAWTPWGGPSTGPSSQACPGLATWSAGVQATEKQTGRPSHAHNLLQNKQSI